jgi:hypothetical protein
MQTECQLVSHGLYLGDSSGREDPRADHLVGGANEWKLVLQLDLEFTPSEVMWGDAGRIYSGPEKAICGRVDSTRRGRFSSVAEQEVAMWEWKDAWILLAISGPSLRGHSLAAVIGNADAINVDIPSRDDLERSVNRLHAAGLVTADRERFRLTRDGRRVLRRAGRAGLREKARLVEAELQRTPFPSEVGGWSLSQTEWEAAYKSYCAAADEWLRRSRETD